MPLIKKVVSASLYIALGYYTLFFLFHLVFDFNHIKFDASKHLIEGGVFVITALLIWFFTRSKFLSSENNIKWLNLYLIHLALIFILFFSLFTVPQNSNSSNEFSLLIDLVAGAILIILPLVFASFSYILFKKFPLSRFSVIPLVVYCFILLFFFQVFINLIV